MEYHRTSGILLHPTSLPGPYGIGDLGPELTNGLIFSPNRSVRSGKCSLWVQPVTETHPTSAFQPLPAIHILSARFFYTKKDYFKRTT